MIIDKLVEKCDHELNSIYNETLKEVLPYILSRSSEISSKNPRIDYDDAVQEGRLAVVVALMKCDKEKYDNMKPYVWTVVKNAYHRMVWETFAQTRIPHLNAVDTDGNVVKKPYFPISLDSVIETKGDILTDEKNKTPEQAVIDGGLISELGKFTMKMYNKLEGLDREVFKCKIHPSQDFLDMMYMEGVNFVHRNVDDELVLVDNFEVPVEYISKYLKVDKNVVGWSLYKIRKMFLSMARYDDSFNGLFEDLVVDKRWPKIHCKVGDKEDLEFKRDIFKKRVLNAKQIGDYTYLESERKDDNGMPYYSRLIKQYDWGCTITIKKNDKYYTIIAEGRFNPRTGAVFGSNNSQEHLPMKWYKTMVKELKDG